MKNFFLILFVLIGIAVFSAIPISSLQHLEFLRDEFNVEGTPQTGYWIYADLKPDGTYSHVEASEEGVTCVDDVARAAILYLREIQRGNSEIFFVSRAREALDFVLSMGLSNGDYYNFIYENGSINKNGITSRPNTDWWAVRAMWATSLGSEVFKSIDMDYSNILLEKSLKTYNHLKKQIQNGLLNNYGDISSVFLLACCDLYKTSKNDEILETIEQISDALMDKSENPYKNFGLIDEGNENFNWHSWGSRQLEALANSSVILNDETLFTKTYGIFKKLTAFIISSGPVYRFWDRVDLYPQLAYGMEVFINSTLSLNKASIHFKDLKKAEETAIVMELLMSWFIGMNDLQESMIGPSNQGYDGMEITHVNKNSGAESTISYLLSLSAIETLPEEYKIYLSKDNKVLNPSLTVEAEKFDWGLSPVEILQNTSYSGNAALSLNGSSGIKEEMELSPLSYGIYGVFGKGNYSGELSVSIRCGENKNKNTINIQNEKIVFLGNISGNGEEEKFSIGFSYDSDESVVLDQIIIIPENLVVYSENLDKTIYISPDENFLKEVNGKIFEMKQNKIQTDTLERVLYKKYDDYTLIQLNGIFNNDGFASNIQRTRGNFDNIQGTLGAGYPLEELKNDLKTNEFMKSGNENQYSSISLLFCDTVPFIVQTDELNNFRLQNQAIEFEPVQVNEIYFLGSANHGNYSSEIKIVYEDDSFESKILSFSDWCSGSSFGEKIAKEFSFRYESNGNKQNINCYLYIQKVKIPEGKVKGIIFSDSINTHIFSITLK